MGIVGPYFFDDGSAGVTVDSEHHVKMLRNFLQPKI